MVEEIKRSDGFNKVERPQHKVVITKPLLMSATEVTSGQFKKFVEASGSAICRSIDRTSEIRLS
jgi:formylglycine-generating enzyme required for sulfatase activity